MKLPLLIEIIRDGIPVHYLVLIFSALLLVLVIVAIFVNQMYKYTTHTSTPVTFRGHSSEVMDPTCRIATLGTMSLYGVVAVMNLIGMIFLRADSICRAFCLVYSVMISYFYTSLCIAQSGGEVYFFKLFQWTDIPNNRLDCGSLLFPKTIQRQHISVAVMLIMQNILVIIVTQLSEQLLLSDNYYFYPCPITNNPIKIALELLQALSFLLSLYGGVLVCRAAQLSNTMSAVYLRLGLIKVIQILPQLQHLTLVVLADKNLLYKEEQVMIHDYPVGPDPQIVRTNMSHSILWGNFAVICECLVAHLIYTRCFAISYDIERYKPIQKDDTSNPDKHSDYKPKYKKSITQNDISPYTVGSSELNSPQILVQNITTMSNGSSVSLVGGRLCIILSQVETDRVINSTPDLGLGEDEINEIFERDKRTAVANRRKKKDNGDNNSFSSIATY